MSGLSNGFSQVFEVVLLIVHEVEGRCDFDRLAALAVEPYFGVTHRIEDDKRAAGSVVPAGIGHRRKSRPQCNVQSVHVGDGRDCVKVNVEVSPEDLELAL